MSGQIKFADGLVLAGTVSLMGAPIVLGEQLNHTLGQVLFYGGLAFLLMFVGWKIFGGRQAAAAGAESPSGNNGAYIGGDNSGTQQVFHGPVTISHAGTAQIAEDPSREFLPKDLTAAKLLDFYGSQTVLRARKQLEPYLGKWLRIQGTVSNVFPDHGDGYLTVGVRLPKTRFLMCNFRAAKEFEVAHLSQGDEIAVIGKIKDISIENMTLVDCEILT